MELEEFRSWLEVNVLDLGEGFPVEFKDGRFNVRKKLMFKDGVSIASMPYPFGEVNSIFICNNINLKNLNNFPTEMIHIPGYFTYIDIRNNPIEEFPYSFTKSVLDGDYYWDYGQFYYNSPIGQMMIDYECFLKIERKLKLNHLIGL
jgi:hypothetical protein